MMNKPSEQELKTFFAYYKQDTDFTAYARLLQSKWREGKGYPMGKSQNGTIYGNYVEKEFAQKKGCNFLTRKIWDIAQKEMKMAKISGAFYKKDRFICNLLTSQAMCFNLFGEFFEEKNTRLVRQPGWLSHSLAVFQAKSLTKLLFLMEVGAETEVSKQLYFIKYIQPIKAKFNG